MLKNPLISVIVPCYNAESFIINAVQSVQCQHYENWEMILVDDGSVDKTPELCDELSRNDNRIKVCHQKNSGVSTARNIGLVRAVGDWIVFLDADDWLSDSAFDILLESVNEDKADVFIFNSYYNNGSLELGGEKFKEEKTIREGTEKRWCVIDTLFPYYDELKNGMKVKSIRAVHGKVYKKKLLDTYNIRFDSTLPIAEDALFNYDVYKYSNAICIKDSYFLHYRINEKSVMHKYNENIDETNNRIMSQFQNKLGSMFMEDDFQAAFLGMAAECVFRSLKLKYLHPYNKERFHIWIKSFKKYVNSYYLKQAMQYPNYNILPIGKKQMMFCFKYRLFVIGILVARVSIIYLKRRNQF